MVNTLIKISKLTKYFDKQKVLDDLSIDIIEGEFISFVGPSGCGKTTLLNLIAGFIPPDSGDICIDGQSVLGLQPQLRDVHTVFQNYALFPHMTVFDNVAFSLRCKKVNREEVHRRVNETLTQVKLRELACKKPHQLSGGQQQRVAIARSIIGRPKVLLLDESLSALDYRLRKSMQSELRQLQKSLGMTFLFVTHDQEEALSMSDRIAVFNNGKIEQLGTPREIYETPRNMRVAGFIGEINTFSTAVTLTQNKHLQVILEDIPFLFENKNNFSKGDSINVTVRPEDIRVYKPTEIESSTNMIPGTIHDLIYKGSTVDLKVRLHSGKIINATEFFDEDDEELDYALNEPVWVHWLAGWEVIFPHET